MEALTLTQQLRSEAMTRTGIVSTISDRVVMDEAFMKLWDAMEAQFQRELENDRDDYLKTLAPMELSQLVAELHLKSFLRWRGNRSKE